MPLQYIQDFNGATTAVIVPIEEWNKITEKFSDIEELPLWQKDIVDQRQQSIAQNPATLRPIEELFEELDKDDQ